MFYEARVEIHHSKPIEAAVYIDVLTHLEINAKRAYYAYLQNLSHAAASPVEHDIYIKAIELLEADELSWFWIETTEPGSSKAKGKARNMAIAVLLPAISYFAVDVIDETKPYKEMKEPVVQAIDLGYEYLTEFIEQKNESYSMKCKREKDGIVIEVKIHPFREERYDIEEKKYPKTEYK